MRAGKLSHFIRIETPVSTKDKFNANVIDWQLFNKVWAKIETLRGYEKSSASASWPTATVKITMRYLKGMLPTMRIVYDGVIYSILNVDDVELKHVEIVLTCETGAKGA